ncbi:MAG: hypothetical protein SchgKO_10910 [Schleiferiaceae bacterium]
MKTEDPKSAEILDEELMPETALGFPEPVVWWESKRILFNVLVGISGLVLVIPNFNKMDASLFMGLVIYGVFANILYCAGFSVELLASFYSKNTLSLRGMRRLLFFLGTAATCVVTLSLAMLTFFM